MINTLTCGLLPFSQISTLDNLLESPGAISKHEFFRIIYGLSHVQDMVRLGRVQKLTITQELSVWELAVASSFQTEPKADYAECMGEASSTATWAPVFSRVCMCTRWVAALAVLH